jgi:nitric oxide reductase subunit B
VNDGYFAARQLEYITNPTNSIFEWMRLPGDVVFILGGVLPFLYLCWLGVRYRVSWTTMEEPADVLFTEITEPVPVGAGSREP